MSKDVESAIAKCQTCMRQTRTNEIRHPAIKIHADSVFDIELDDFFFFLFN